MKRKVDSITKEKIEFIDNNSHILNCILNNKIVYNKTVIEVVASIIINDKPLNECNYIDELKSLLIINKDLVLPEEKDESSSFCLIFNVAHYVNATVIEKELNNSIRDRLRIYTANFSKGRNFSKNYRKYIILGKEKDNLMIKKIDV